MIKEYLKPLKTTVYVYVMIICTTLYLRAFQEKKKEKSERVETYDFLN